MIPGTFRRSCLTAALAAAAGASVSAAAPREETPIVVGARVPAFAGVLLDGTAVSLERLLGVTHKPGTDVLVISFFATYCEPCKKGLPMVERVVARLQKRGVKALLLACGESATLVEPFAKQNKLTSPIMTDPYLKVCPRLGVTARLPATYVIDRTGVLRASFGAESATFEAELGQAVEAALLPASALQAGANAAGTGGP